MNEATPVTPGPRDLHEDIEALIRAGGYTANSVTEIYRMALFGDGNLQAAIWDALFAIAETCPRFVADVFLQLARDRWEKMRAEAGTYFVVLLDRGLHDVESVVWGSLVFDKDPATRKQLRDRLLELLIAGDIDAGDDEEPRMFYGGIERAAFIALLDGLIAADQAAIKAAQG